MPKITKRIEIVSSANIDLSSMGHLSRDSVLAVLTKHYTDVRISLINNLADLQALVERRPDLVFLGMHFVPIDHDLGLEDPDKVWLSEYLDEHAIAYTGSNRPARELDNNKPLAKQRVLEAGLDTSPFRVVKQHRPLLSSDFSLTFPLFIKPTSRGGGTGIDSASVAYTFEQAQAKISLISSELKSDSLVEQYLPGREFSVAILKDEHSEKHLIMPIELIAPPDKFGMRILTEQVKTADTEKSVVVLNEIIKSKVSTLAIDVFHALGARDYGRIDIRMDSNGTPQFLEANLVPSLRRNKGNYFPRACLLNINLSYEPMILSIVRLALARSLDLIQPIFNDDDLALPVLEPVLEV